MARHDDAGATWPGARTLSRREWGRDLALRPPEAASDTRGDCLGTSIVTCQGWCWIWMIGVCTLLTWKSEEVYTVHVSTSQLTQNVELGMLI